MEFATIVAQNVLERLASHTSQEISLAWGVQLELTKLNMTLSTIKLLLKDAERKQFRNPLITLWLGNLKDVCHDIDDVLDKVEFQKLRMQVLVNNHGSLKGKVHQFFSRWNLIVFNFKMGRKVKEIRERLAEIDNEKREFSLIHFAELGEDGRAPDNKRTTDSLVEASDVIGREDDKNKIIHHLLNDTDLSREENVSVISIMGFGGLGKTTLAKLVYNNSLVEAKFETLMWICVSTNFDVQTLVEGILNATTKQKCEDLSLDLLKRRLLDTLREKTFLLVLDDVWDIESTGINIDKWKDLKALLNVGARGSRIIITTRNKSVASLVNPIHIHALEGLSHKDCMTLFKKMAFRKGEEQRYPHLIEIGESIVKKCGGVPLAVVALGSSLFLERERHQWEGVRDDPMWSSKGNDRVLTALKLSYDALPPYLKPCFAFCSLFPKDYQFTNVELVPMWMAQGFLNSVKENQDLEQMGIDYIRQFGSRSLFQVDVDMGTMISFKIHDLVHDLVISVGQQEYSTVDCRPSSSFEKIRHVSISSKDLSKEEVQIPNFMLQLRKLRTILFLGDAQITNQTFLKALISRFKYMRVLDLKKTSLEELPSSIGTLCHLRFLHLDGNVKLKRLPNSICKLLHLQCLSLAECDALEEIPSDIGNLINLRILEMTTKQVDLPKGIKRLTLLQTLCFNKCVNLKSLGGEIQYLTNLRKLVILDSGKLESLPPNMKRLAAIDTLWISNCEKLKLTGSGLGPQRLRSVMISCSDIEDLPPWLQESALSLQSIAIHKCENLKEIEELQNFTSLERLFIGDCPKLLALPQGLHCLTELRELRISNCPKLLALPQGLHCLTEFRELRIGNCPELIKSCRRQLEGEDWSKMARDAKIILDKVLWSPEN